MDELTAGGIAAAAVAIGLPLAQALKAMAVALGKMASARIKGGRRDDGYSGPERRRTGGEHARILRDITRQQQELAHQAAFAQKTQIHATEAMRDLTTSVRELATAVGELRTDTSTAHAEINTKLDVMMRR